jgi:GT2 family glycosyltransferase
VSEETAHGLGVVVIGRNEGERLKRCLRSVAGRAEAVVYVDSGSTDGSVEAARSLSVDVIEMDPKEAFRAGRSRNAGYERLLATEPDLEYVQFVDGDCELLDGWLPLAVNAIRADESVGAVCGRVRERSPEASLYNRLIDMEWDVPAGEVKACGGIAMFRANALRRTGGFDPDLIAGEEPELCLRVRREGFRILRLDGDMTLHDAAMTRFGQWFRRAVRSGWAYAEAVAMHGAAEERHGVRPSVSIWFWSLVLPASIAVAAATLDVLALLAALLYALLLVRISLRRWRSGAAPGDALLYGMFCVLAKWPQLVGQLLYLWSRLRRAEPRPLEYKSSG